LRPGVVTITKEGGAKERIFVRGGFAEVNPQASHFSPKSRCRSPSSMPRGWRRKVRDAQEDVSDAQDDETRRARRRIWTISWRCKALFDLSCKLR